MNQFKKLFMALICLIATNTWATTYYVSKTGNNDSSGLSTGKAWRTLTYAASNLSPVAAGDIVYVKAENYGAEYVVFKKSGTSGNPITFQGYKTTPGDAPPVLVNNANPYASFSATDMPLYDGGNRATSLMGFTTGTQEYLIIKNFQIQNYGYGFHTGNNVPSTKGHLTLNNVNTMNTGDISASYAGVGILLGSMGSAVSNYNTLTNCLVVNSAAEGFGINGSNNTLTGCKVYCNQNTSNAATDYYILVWGSSNIVTTCHIERTAGLSHQGHGMGVKGNEDTPGTTLDSAKYNVFNYNTATNMGESFYVRHRSVKYNTFYHCKAVGTHTGVTGSGEGEGNCIMTRDGASNNVFDGCIAENCATGLTFGDTVEDGDWGVNPTGHPGNYNKYVNCLIYNCYVGVSYTDYGIQSDAGDNTIANCTFYKNRYLHYAARHSTKMKYIGNIYYGTNGVSDGYFKGSTYASDIVVNGATTYFKQCDFYNIISMPAGYVGTNGNIGTNPLFVNAATNDFHLNNTSPCIDQVNAITLAYNPADFDTKPHYNGVKSDIGALEFYTGSIICLGKSTSLTANNSSASYSWLPATGLSATTGATVTASPIVTTTYTVTGTATNGTLTKETFKVTVNSIPVAAGGNHSAMLYCGVCVNGGIALMGLNSSGQLANGTTTQTNNPVFLTGIIGITAVATGGNHSVFLKNDGTVWASGDNTYGQLGDGTMTGRTSPVQVSSLSGIIAISTQNAHTLFLKNDGTVWACGLNSDGQLGDGTTTNRSTPVQVSGLTGVIAIAGGGSHSLFLKSDNTVRACGLNTNGQLGDSTTVSKTSVVTVKGLSAIKGIAAGGNHSLFLENAGTVKACGLNTSGQLGDGTTTQKTTARAVNTVNNVIKISAGTSHSIFLKNTGYNIWATGNNTYGQLGDGTTTQRNSPVEVSSLTIPVVTIIGISAGNNHSLFLENDGSVWSCGLNGSGQLGDGTYTNRSSVVQVPSSNTCGPLGAPQNEQTGINLSVAAIGVYPNPADGALTIQLPRLAEQPTTVTLFDALGRVVAENKINTGEIIKNISTRDLTAGIYFLRIQNKDEIVKQKIVIEHNK